MEDDVAGIIYAGRPYQGFAGDGGDGDALLDGDVQARCSGAS